MLSRRALGTAMLAFAAAASGCTSKTNLGQGHKDASATGGTSGVGGSGTSVSGSGGAFTPWVLSISLPATNASTLAHAGFRISSRNESQPDAHPPG